MAEPIKIAKNGLRWVFFDLDDTLFDFRANSDSALLKLYKTDEYISCLYPDYQQYVDVYHTANSQLWEAYHHAEITADVLRRERFQALFRGAGVAPDADLAESWDKRYLDILSDESRLVPDALDIIERAREHYLIGILSNGFREVQYKKLRTTGLWRYVQRMVVSDEIGVNKPDARLFRFAEQAVGARPEECLMIGDNPDADIKGAIDAGWRAVYFNRVCKPAIVAGVPETDSLADIVFV